MGAGDILEEIVSLRNNYDERKHMSIRQAGQMKDKLNRYLAVVENYLELKANAQIY